MPEPYTALPANPLWPHLINAGWVRSILVNAIWQGRGPCRGSTLGWSWRYEELEYWPELRHMLMLVARQQPDVLTSGFRRYWSRSVGAVERFDLCDAERRLVVLRIGTRQDEYAQYQRQVIALVSGEDVDFAAEVILLGPLLIEDMSPCAG